MCVMLSPLIQIPDQDAEKALMSTTIEAEVKVEPETNIFRYKLSQSRTARKYPVNILHVYCI